MRWDSDENVIMIEGIVNVDVLISMMWKCWVLWWNEVNLDGVMKFQWNTDWITSWVIPCCVRWCEDF